MECHKCQWNGKKSRRCIRCAESRADIPLNRHGQTQVGFDEIAGTRFEPRTQTPDMGEPVEAPPVHAPGGVFISPAAADILCAFLRKMATLTPRELLVLARRMEAATSCDGRPTLAEIGTELRCSKQAVKYLLGNIAAKAPELLALFPGMRQTLRPEQRERADAPEEPRQGFLDLEYGEVK